MFSADSLKFDSTNLLFPDMPDSERVDIIEPKDLNISPIPEEDIFDAQLAEAKSIFAEAVISDLTGDTLEE